jgi:hypothetical protein
MVQSDLEHIEAREIRSGPLIDAATITDADRRICADHRALQSSIGAKSMRVSAARISATRLRSAGAPPKVAETRRGTNDCKQEWGKAAIARV